MALVHAAVERSRAAEEFETPKRAVSQYGCG